MTRTIKLIDLTEKELQLILFIREEMAYGRGTLITHNGQPQRIEDIKKTKFFNDNDKKEKKA